MSSAKRRLERNRLPTVYIYAIINAKYFVFLLLVCYYLIDIIILCITYGILYFNWPKSFQAFSDICMLFFLLALSLHHYTSLHVTHCSFL